MFIFTIGDDIINNRSSYSVYLSLLIFIFVAILSGFRNQGNNISFLQSDYNGILIYIINALIMIPSFIITCSIMPRVKVVELISSNSLFTMCSHMIILEYIKDFIIEFTFISATISTFTLVAVYVIFLISLSKIKSKKFKNKLTYIGIQV